MAPLMWIILAFDNSCDSSPITDSCIPAGQFIWAKLRYSTLDTTFQIPPPVQSLQFATSIWLTIRIFLFSFLVLPIETQLAMKETRKPQISLSLSLEKKKNFTKRNPLWTIPHVQMSPIQSALRTLTPYLPLPLRLHLRN